jgi:hypothetical protein
MDAKQIQIFYEPKDHLRMTIGDRSYPTVKPVWSSPIARPGKYLSLLDGKGTEIVMVQDLGILEPRCRKAVEAELRRRYLTAVIDEIVSAKEEYGAAYWRVTTDRGTRDFVTENLQENALWYSDTHLMLLDTDGNRFEVPNTEKLDPKSKAILHTIL